MKKLFELHQKITLMANEYRVLVDEGNQPKLAAYAKQKRLAVREQFTLFSDDSQKTVLATSKARNIMDISPTFDVFDSNQKLLAVFKKEFSKSLLVSTWSIYSADGQTLLFSASEKSKAVAIARRVWELVPYVSEVVPFPMRFHFSIKADGEIVGEYTKITTIRDNYALYLKENHIQSLDMRAWMVLAVLLDAMQSR